MDFTQIIVGVIALVGSLGGSIIGMIMNQKLSAYKIEQVEKEVAKIPDLEKEAQLLHSEIEKETQNLHNEIEKETQAIHGEIDSFVSNSSERRKMIEDIQEDVEQLKNDVNSINTRIALLENEVKLFKQQLPKFG